MPIEDIEEVFDNIYEEAPNSCVLLCSYVEATYVRGIRVRRRRNPARFPPMIWSMYEQVLNRVQRTNNKVEGWHSKFQHMLNCHHPSIWKFLEYLKKDQRDNEVIILQLRAGHRNIKHPIKKRNIINSEQIERIVAQYERYKANNDIKTYLRTIGYKLKRQE